MTNNESTSPPSLPPKTHLTQPLLHVTGLVGSIKNEEIVEVLRECLRLRLHLNREGESGYSPVTGTIEFESLDKAEKAFATKNGHIFTSHDHCTLHLHLSPPSSTTANPVPRAQPRLIKSLPRTYTAGKVFDLCRPFGPLHSVALQLAPAYPPGSGPPKFKGQALVTYYEEDDAQKAMEGLHLLEVEGQSIAIAVFDEKRAQRGAARRSDMSSHGSHQYRQREGSPSTFEEASPTVQHRFDRTSQWASSPSSTPSKYPSTLSAGANEFVSSPAMSRNVSGASQWSNGTAETSTYDGSPKMTRTPRDGRSIDPCNLFVKSLDPTITSQDLRDAFSPFGDIVSARVMETLEHTPRSKEFGFVSFKEPLQAARALHEMDGKRLRGMNITVRIHEPKQLRERRMSDAHRGGTSESGKTNEGSEVAELEQAMKGLLSSTKAESGVQPDVAFGSQAVEAEVPSTVSSPKASPHDRLVLAVRAIAPEEKTNEIVELLEGLPKKDRALCLLNSEYLEQKVQDALLVLDADDDDEPETPKPVSPSNANPATSPSPSRPLPDSISALTELPAVEIVPVLPQVTQKFSLPAPFEEDVEKTKEFVKSLEALTISQQKQKLGEKLFKVVKSTGIKRAPKITIDLLDSEDLYSLAILMHYPAIIKEKAALIATA